MSSVFDLPLPPEPPTWAEFEAKLGLPALTFDIAQAQVAIPTRAADCCRTVHQAHCPQYVALSLVGCHFLVGYPDGSVASRSPARQVFDGDVLARPRDLAAAVEAVNLTVIATAEADGGQVTSMRFEVFLLNLELAEIWRYLMAERNQVTQQMLEDADALEASVISALPVEVLLAPEEQPQIARLMARADFHPVRAYAGRVMVLPHEIGRTDDARYVTSAIWGQPNRVPRSVEAILADPLEAR